MRLQSTMGMMTRDRRSWWSWVVFGGIWILLCRNLSVHWLVNPQYFYGWLVPALGIYSAFGRWKTRPEPGAQIEAGRWLAVAAAAAFFPTWLVAQPNPDWRMVNWSMTAETAVMTLGAIAWIGGRSWLLHFAFPVCFIFTAVAWPRPWEIPITDSMMRGVAALTVEVLNAAGVVALQQGNVIEVKAGFIGVDEACSGVRSLQAAIMASLFFGELYRFGVLRRMLLLLLGVLVALVTNVARTFFLAWTASVKGIDAVHRWHDPAGGTVMTGCLIGIWLAAMFLGRKCLPPRVSQGISGARPLPTGFVAGLAVWFVFVVGFTEIWYHTSGSSVQSAWEVVPPFNGEPFRISPDAAQELQADRTIASTWNQPDGSRWVLFFFEWKAGPMRSRVLARLHQPDRCLTAVGLRMLEDRGVVEAQGDGIALSFHAYTFEQDGRPIYVYHGVWQIRGVGAERRGELAESIHLASLQAVLWRERNLGEQIVEIAVSGYTNAAAADAAFQRNVREVVRLRGQPGGQK